MSTVIPHWLHHMGVPMSCRRIKIDSVVSTEISRVTLCLRVVNFGPRCKPPGDGRLLANLGRLGLKSAYSLRWIAFRGVSMAEAALARPSGRLKFL
jgi:hypothetical protein